MVIGVGRSDESRCDQPEVWDQLDRLRSEGGLVLVIGGTIEGATERIAEEFLTPLPEQKAHQLVVDPAEQYQETEEELRASLPGGDNGEFSYVDKVFVPRELLGTDLEERSLFCILARFGEEQLALNLSPFLLE